MASGPYAVQVVDQPDEEIVGRLGDGISAFNFAASGIADGRWLFAAIQDEQGELAGGIYGWTWGGTCWIERLWVREDERRRGAGSALLDAAEAEAIDRGCAQLALATHSFQVDFYRRRGFEVTGELPDYPNGYAFFLLRKPLGG